jgi:hypothetical protein
MVQLKMMNDLVRFVMPKNIFLILLAGILSFGQLKAQDNSGRLPMPLFQSEEILNLTLKADFKAVFSVKVDSAYFPAKITLTDNAGLNTTIDIKLRARGKTRRQNTICRFAPLRLNFPKDEVKNTPFEGQKAIKLVTHCDKSGNYEQNTVMEYLIYKVFNVLTDSSFKVRPAVINYVFDDKKADSIKRFAFFIEREKHMADRLQGIEIEAEKTHPDRLDEFHTCLVDMFQYMIGNTDYSVYEQHNIILVADSARLLPFIPVPYDFDWSGLVSAVYAVPNPLMNTDHVTDRVYRGLRKKPEIVLHTIELFKTKKQEIYQLFENFELLNADAKKRAIKYLDEFYYIINNERQVQIEFFDRARTTNQ